MECKNCSGKGHVLSGLAVVCVPFITPILGIFERNDPNGFTRQRCDICNGKGVR